ATSSPCSSLESDPSSSVRKHPYPLGTTPLVTQNAERQTLVCCSDYDQTRFAREEVNVPCITMHPGFAVVCLDVHVLRTAYYAYRQDYMEDAQQLHSKRFRYIANGKCIICWNREFLGRLSRIPIPSFVVNHIGQTFPNEHGLP
uniref:Uncharacterized protein n=1 Tax=Electrophorus electricus TaxID=8005 RepID=A0A4W4FHQ1_ELEEL